MRTKAEQLTHQENIKIEREVEQELEFIRSLPRKEREDYVWQMWKEQEAMGLMEDD